MNVRATGICRFHWRQWETMRAQWGAAAGGRGNVQMRL